MSRTNRRKSGNRWFVDVKDLPYRSESTAMKSVAKLFSSDNVNHNGTSDMKIESKKTRRVSQRKQLSKIVKKGVDIEDENNYDESQELKQISRISQSYW